MQTNLIIQQTEDYVLHTYNRFPVAFVRGKGVYLEDAEGKQYLDFGAGIAVNALGYADEVLTKCMHLQLDLLWHTSNLFYHPQLAEASQKLVEISGLSKVFFTNSGAEAIEGAIKAAKKYYYQTRGRSGAGIVAMEHSFHGRSVGALSVTGNAHYRTAFLPLMDGVSFARFNDIDSVLACVNDETCAILLESVQGEGGIYPADPAFLAQLRTLCDERDILLIFDEIQCGMGRTGDWFAWQGYGVAPDIMTTAKALGCGIPVGAFVLGEKAAKASLVPGDHGTTYGGNPLACAAVSTVIDIYRNRGLIEHVRTIGPCLEEALDQLVADYPALLQRRGKGLMQGIEVSGASVGDIANAALKQGLVVLTAGSNVLRFVPPLVITRAHVDEMILKLRAALEACSIYTRDHH